MAYRDDLEAAAARVRALEEEVARGQAELAAEREANQRLTAELETDGPGGRTRKAAEAELARRAEVGRNARLPVVKDEAGRSVRLPGLAAENEAVAYDEVLAEHRVWFDRASSRAGLTASGWFAGLYTLVGGFGLAATLPGGLWRLMLTAVPATALAIRQTSRRLTRRAGARQLYRLRGLPFTVAGAETAFLNTGEYRWLQVDLQLAPVQVLPKEGLIEDLASSLRREHTVQKQSERSYRLRFNLGGDTMSDWWGNRRGLLGFHAVVDAVLRPLHAVHPLQRVRFELD